MGLEQFKSFAKGYDKKIDSNKDVWIYTRVSSKDQESNKSLQTQFESSTRFAKDKNYLVTFRFGGTYESASGDFTRKEFKRLIDEVRRAKLKPHAILINTISRFSRTGGEGVGLASELVNDLGVHLIEVSTGKSTETEDGKIEIYRGLLQARQENIDRLRVTLPGMKRFLENGYWLGKAPKGYDQFGTKVKRAKFHSDKQKIVMNSEGKLLKMAWEWKLKGDKDYIIIQKLCDLGVEITKQIISAMWRNPFYCGISAHKMLDGEVVEGKWEKMVSEQDFLMVQEILNGNRFGYKHEKSNLNRPLNGFISCNACGNKLTGYKVEKKGLHYYKCQSCKGGSINANTTIRSNGQGANNLFQDLLSKFELSSGLHNAFKEQLKMTYETLNNEGENENEIIGLELVKLEDGLKKLKRRFALGDIDDKETFNELKDEFENKIRDLNTRKANNVSKISNLDSYIETSCDVVSNISKYWGSDDIETKKRIQELVFPDGLSLDIKNRVYLTEKTNVIFEITRDIAKDSKDIESKKPTDYIDGSSLVAGTGLEPVTFGL
ncbi:recombinase family protein [Flavobacterium sp.]|uniref:recombinase family protein n=1 Tax=Flavobacterium sp. TaxID=239 RepID=UPI003454C36A